MVDMKGKSLRIRNSHLLLPKEGGWVGRAVGRAVGRVGGECWRGGRGGGVEGVGQMSGELHASCSPSRGINTTPPPPPPQDYREVYPPPPPTLSPPPTPPPIHVQGVEKPLYI